MGMPRRGGYASLSVEGSITQEFDNFTCNHCQRVTHVAAGQKAEDMGGLCKQCMGLICKRCLGQGCTPFEKKLDAWESADRLYRAARGDYR